MPKFLDVTDTALAREALGAVGDANGTIINFADYGACNGTTNDRVAFSTALGVLAAAGGGTLLLPPKSIAIQMNADPTFLVPAQTRIVGTPGATTILLSSTANTSYMAFAGNAGDDVSFEGITFVRNTNCTGMVFHPQGGNGFHVRNCVINGQTDIHDKTFHGWVLHSDDDKRNITIKDSTVTKVSYGLLQANGVAGDIDTIVVDNCDFTFNYGDDLEFNAPLSKMTNVLVSNCRFTDMQGTNLAAGMAIGLAHVDGAVIRDCYIDGTYSDGIHLEWGSSNILISNNRIVGCANNTGTNATELDRASINIMAQCHDVIVSGNTIDHRPNTNTNGLHAITVRNYTGGLSLAGDPCVPPWRITITDNIIHCGENFGGIWACDIADITVRGNRIVGDGTVTAGVWDDGNTRAGIMIDGTNTIIADNAVSGFRYGITGPLAEDLNGEGGVSLPFADRRALGNPGVVNANMVSDCYVGVVSVPAGSANISGNTLKNCVRPIAVGENANPAQPCAVTDNLAQGCTHPLEVGGKQVLIRSGGSTVTVGTGKTIQVVDNLLAIPVGAVATFSGGGQMRITTAVTGTHLYSPGTTYAVTGTVVGASITAGETAVVTGIPHSSTAANDRIAVTGNADSIANAYPFDVAVDDVPGEATMPRWAVNTYTGLTGNDVLRWTYFTARRTETITKVRTFSGNTAAVGASLCRIGIYSIDAYGNFTLVASTPNDTSLWAATYTGYTKALSASFVKRAGQRYAVGILVRGTSVAPTITGTNYSPLLNETPRLTALAVGATDLASFYDNGVGVLESPTFNYIQLLP